jgi:1,4-alpha-glucan branching enzyme
VPPTIRYTPQLVTGTVIAGEGTSTAAPEAAELIDVDLELSASTAGEVYVAGSFNDWNPTADALEKGEDGVWHITLKLSPGEYEYKFVVDGTWVEDPGNPNTVSDPYGGKNSVLTVE